MPDETPDETRRVRRYLLDNMRLFVGDAFEHLDEVIFQINENHGWHDEPRTVGDYMALMHSELSECLEAYRHGNPPSDHIPEVTGMEEELADVIIRIMDFARMHDLDVGTALVAKIEFNDSRPYRHGGKKL